MAKVLTFEIREDEYQAIEEMLKQVSTEVRNSLEAMRKDQAEIDRLTDEIEQIKAATEQSKLQSDKILAELEAKHSIFI